MQACVYAHTHTCTHMHTHTRMQAHMHTHTRARTDNTTTIYTCSQITIPSNDTTYWCSGHRLPQSIREQTAHMIYVRLYMIIYLTYFEYNNCFSMCLIFAHTLCLIISIVYHDINSCYMFINLSCADLKPTCFFRLI